MLVPPKGVGLGPSHKDQNLASDSFNIANLQNLFNIGQN
jgi:hypothetical protein